MKEGSIIKLDYDLWVRDEETDEYRLYETTTESVAKENDIHDEHADYTPITAIVGKGTVLEGLDEALAEAEIGDEQEIIIAPEKAYGERRADLVDLVKRHELEAEMASSEHEEDRQIYVGKHVHFKGRTGTILMITGRKCRIDFNHPFAGKSLKYVYAAREEITGDENIAREMATITYPMGNEFEFSFNESELQVKLAEYCKFDPQWRTVKFQMISTLREAFPDIDKIVFMEEYPRPAAPASEDEAAADSEEEISAVPDGEEPVMEAGESISDDSVEAEEEPISEPVIEDSGSEEPEIPEEEN